jgi:predicted amidohydrolase
MRAVLAQMSPVAGAPGENGRTAARVIAAAHGDLVAFPELFLSGYRLADLDAVACAVDGPELGALGAAAAAAGRAVAIGFVERCADGFANSVACFAASGDLVGVYRKVMLFGEEAVAFKAGTDLVLVELAGRTVAPLICFDVEFPELARAAARAGADLLLTVSANMDPYGREHLVHGTARALENRLPHLYVNRVGSESGFDFVGGSRSIGPDGTVTAEAGERDTCLLGARVDATRTVDGRVNYLQILDSTSLPGVSRESGEAPSKPTG